MHEAILRDVQAAGGVRLDASEVEVLTLPCLQILLAAMRDAKVWIEQPSDAFVAAFADLGLDWSRRHAANCRSPPPSRRRGDRSRMT